MSKQIKKHSPSPVPIHGDWGSRSRCRGADDHSQFGLGLDGAVAPSERIVVGGIGIGNRGTYDLGCFLEQKDVQFAAVCDVKEARRTGGQEDGRWTVRQLRTATCIAIFANCSTAKISMRC